MTTTQINMRAITNEKTFHLGMCRSPYPCYSFDFMYFTQSLYNIQWKVKQFPKSYT